LDPVQGRRLPSRARFLFPPDDDAGGTIEALLKFFASALRIFSWS
jgi:hypothetical protein